MTSRPATEWDAWLAAADGYVSDVRALIEGRPVEPGLVPEPPRGPVPAEYLTRAVLATRMLEALLSDASAARLQARDRIDAGSKWGQAPQTRPIGVL